MLYVAVQFQEDGPIYHYHCSDEALIPEMREGAFVRVPTRRGTARVRVAGVSIEQPRDNNNRLIETKAVLQLAAPPADDAA